MGWKLHLRMTAVEVVSPHICSTRSDQVLAQVIGKMRKTEGVVYHQMPGSSEKNEYTKELQYKPFFKLILLLLFLCIFLQNIRQDLIKLIIFVPMPHPWKCTPFFILHLPCSTSPSQLPPYSDTLPTPPTNRLNLFVLSSIHHHASPLSHTHSQVDHTFREC